MPASIRRMENKRLVYYMTPATPEFWDDRWQKHELSVERYENVRRYGAYPSLMTLYKTYLPKEGKILEAGCGLADMVVALREVGYDMEGVDWAEPTIARVLEFVPDLAIRCADVLQLDVPDSYYHGYISLGVVEHRREGPEPFLDEALRVLAPGGIAMISVPYVNPLRYLKGRLGWFRKSPGDFEFYQYAFSRNEIEEYIRGAGFQVITSSTYDGYKGIFDEFPSLKTVPKLGWRFSRYIEKRQPDSYLETHFGHMLMVVAQKPA